MPLSFLLFASNNLLILLSSYIHPDMFKLTWTHHWECIFEELGLVDSTRHRTWKLKYCISFLIEEKRERSGCKCGERWTHNNAQRNRYSTCVEQCSLACVLIYLMEPLSCVSLGIILIALRATAAVRLYFSSELAPLSYAYWMSPTGSFTTTVLLHNNYLRSISGSEWRAKLTVLNNYQDIY